MKVHLFFILAVLMVQISFGQIIPSDNQNIPMGQINGEWICEQSANTWGIRKNQQNTDVQIKLIISESNYIEIYYNDKLMKSSVIAFTDIIDKSITRHSKRIWMHYTFKYKLEQLKDNKVEWPIDNYGTIDIWNGESIMVSDEWDNGYSYRFIKTKR